MMGFFEFANAHPIAAVFMVLFMSIGLAQAFAGLVDAFRRR